MRYGGVVIRTYEEEEYIADQGDPSERQLFVYSEGQGRTVDTSGVYTASKADIDDLLKSHVQDICSSGDIDDVSKGSRCRIRH